MTLLLIVVLLLVVLIVLVGVLVGVGVGVVGVGIEGIEKEGESEGEAMGERDARVFFSSTLLSRSDGELELDLFRLFVWLLFELLLLFRALSEGERLRMRCVAELTKEELLAGDGDSDADLLSECGDIL